MALFTRFSTATSDALALHVRRYALEWATGLVALASLACCAYLLAAPPRPYPAGATIVFTAGASAHRAAQELAQAGLVREPLMLELLWRVSGTANSLQPGAYRFNAPESVFTTAWRLATGAYGIPMVRITFPEGTTVLDMGKKLSVALPEVTLSDFIAAAGPYEGYLFPDTYAFQPSATAASIVERMRKEFAQKTDPLAPEVAASGHTLADIIVMASIIEREARTDTDRRMISGILWNRINKGMPLQVDAVFGYINSRQTYSPSYHDLKVDSPYNTYVNRGLPPGPISNPGLSSIEAALHPTKTDDLYYITGRDGLMHYAKTYAGQKANIAKYL